jgi:hypothetical protein
LNQASYRTSGNWGQRLFTADTVMAMLQNRFYLGEVKYQGVWQPGRHEALISRELFEKCQAIRATRRARTVRGKSTTRVYPLSGMVVCARCGQPMRGQAGATYRYYRDPNRSIHQCKQPLIRADRTETTLVQFLSELALPNDWSERVLWAKLAQRGDEETIANKRRQLEQRLALARKLYELGDMSEEEYFGLRNDMKRKLAALQPVQDPDLETAATLINNLPTILKGPSLKVLHRLFVLLFKTVYVDDKKRGAVVAVEPLPHIKQLLDVSNFAGNDRIFGREKTDDKPDSGRTRKLDVADSNKHNNISHDAGKNEMGSGKVPLSDPWQKPVVPAEPAILLLTDRGFFFASFGPHAYN